MITEKGIRYNRVQVFFPFEIMNYVNIVIAKYRITPDNAVRFIMLENPNCKKFIVDENGKEKWQELCDRNKIKNYARRDSKILKENEKLKIKLKDLEAQLYQIKEDQQTEKTKAESYAKQTEAYKKSVDLKQQKEKERQKLIQELMKKIECIKEQCIQNLIKNEKADIKTEYWAIENIRTELQKLKHPVDEIDTEILLQDPRIQDAIKIRENENEKQLQEYKEHQKQEKQRLENLKQNDYDQWIIEHLKQKNVRYTETKTEIKVNAIFMEEYIERGFYSNQIDFEELEKLGFKHVQTNFTTDDYWTYTKKALPTVSKNALFSYPE